MLGFTVINFIFIFIALQLIVVTLEEIYYLDFGYWLNSKIFVIIIKY